MVRRFMMYLMFMEFIVILMMMMVKVHYIMRKVQYDDDGM